MNDKVENWQMLFVFKTICLCAQKDTVKLLLTLHSKGNEYYSANTKDIKIGFAHLMEYNTRWATSDWGIGGQLRGL